MTQQRAKEMLPFVTAIAEGETVQFSHYDLPDRWIDLDNTNLFDFSPDRLRVKAEPREFWLVPYRDGMTTHSSLSAAELYRGADPHLPIIHVREVL